MRVYAGVARRVYERTLVLVGSAIARENVQAAAVRRRLPCSCLMRCAWLIAASELASPFVESYLALLAAELGLVRAAG